MKYFGIIIAGLMLGAESRSLSSSSFEEELRELEWNPMVNQVVAEYEKIIPSTESRNSFVSSNQFNQKEELRSSIVSQSQKLEKLLNNFAEKSKTDGTIDKEEIEIFQNINSLKDMVDSIQELDVHYLQDGSQDDAADRHVKSRYEDSSAQFPSIQTESREERINEEKIGDENEENDLKEVDNMFVDLQNQINRMRNYFEKNCRKRHPTVKTSGNNREISTSFSSRNPNKISLIN